jgi:hypothetical protein
MLVQMACGEIDIAHFRREGQVGDEIRVELFRRELFLEFLKLRGGSLLEFFPFRARFALCLSGLLCR